MCVYELSLCYRKPFSAIGLLPYSHHPYKHINWTVSSVIIFIVWRKLCRLIYQFTFSEFLGLPDVSITYTGGQLRWSIITLMIWIHFTGCQIHSSIVHDCSSCRWSHSRTMLLLVSLWNTEQTCKFLSSNHVSRFQDALFKMLWRYFWWTEHGTKHSW